MEQNGTRRVHVHGSLASIFYIRYTRNVARAQTRGNRGRSARQLLFAIHRGRSAAAQVHTGRAVSLATEFVSPTTDWQRGRTQCSRDLSYHPLSLSLSLSRSLPRICLAYILLGSTQRGKEGSSDDMLA